MSVRKQKDSAAKMRKTRELSLEWILKSYDPEIRRSKNHHAYKGDMPRGIYVTRETFYKYVRELESKNPAFARRLASVAVARKTSAELAPAIENANRLQREVDYLRWWNTGERHGFVERLLREVKR